MGGLFAGRGRDGSKFQASLTNFGPSATLIRTNGSLITIIKTDRIGKAIS